MPRPLDWQNYTLESKQVQGTDIRHHKERKQTMMKQTRLNSQNEVGVAASNTWQQGWSRQLPSVHILRRGITEYKERTGQDERLESWETVKPLRNCKPSQLLPTTHTTFKRKE